MPGPHHPPSRRAFLRLAAALAMPPLLGRSARGARPAPSERITIGLIGCGGMGLANMHEFLQRAQVQALAVCDPDAGRRAKARSRIEAHYAGNSPTGGYAGCADYNDYRELLARDDIDAVIIASPDHWHALHVVDAARAGKDVYGEKPLSLTIRQGRIMADTVRRTGCVFQTGSQQRSDARFRLACQLVRNGRLGAIRRVVCGLPGGEITGNHPPRPVPEGFDYDLWLGPAPWEPYCEQRTHYVFRHILDYSGGKLTDWGAHHVDIAQWALGTMESGPVRIEGAGTYPPDGLWDAPVTYAITCRYADGVEMVITSDAPNGVRFEGDEGWLFVTRGRIEADPPGLLGSVIGPAEDRLEVSTNHHDDFIECVRSRREPVAPIEQAHRSITIAHLGNIALQVRRPLTWDPHQERIVDDPGASRMLDRPMRAPWSL